MVVQSAGSIVSSMAAALGPGARCCPAPAAASANARNKALELTAFLVEKMPHPTT
jgi:hypothetical protein